MEHYVTSARGHHTAIPKEHNTRVEAKIPSERKSAKKRSGNIAEAGVQQNER